MRTPASAWLVFVLLVLAGEMIAISPQMGWVNPERVTACVVIGIYTILVGFGTLIFSPKY